MSNEKLTVNRIDSKYENNLESFYKTMENLIEDYHKTVSHFQIKSLNSNKSLMDRFYSKIKLEKNPDSYVMNNYILHMTNHLISEMIKSLELQSKNLKKSFEDAENSMSVWNNGIENIFDLWKNMFDSNPFFKSEKEKAG